MYLCSKSYKSPPQHRGSLTKKGLRKATRWNGVKENSDSRKKTLKTHIVEEERKYGHRHISFNDIFQRMGLVAGRPG